MNNQSSQNDSAGSREKASCLAGAEIRQAGRTPQAVLRNKIAEVDTDGLTVEARLVEVLVHEALVGKNRLPRSRGYFRPLGRSFAAAPENRRCQRRASEQKRRGVAISSGQQSLAG